MVATERDHSATNFHGLPASPVGVVPAGVVTVPVSCPACGIADSTLAPPAVRYLAVKPDQESRSVLLSLPLPKAIVADVTSRSMEADPLKSGPCNSTVQTGCFSDGGIINKIPENRLSANGMALLRALPVPIPGFTGPGGANWFADRPNTQDQRKDSVVKVEIFDREIRHAYRVIGVFDDRAQVVRAWRALGLTVFQVADGNF